LFFYPSHAEGHPHETTIVGGPLLDWRELQPENGGESDFGTALARDVGSKRRSTTEEGKALGQWSRTNASYFQVAEAIRDHCPERIRSDAGGKIEIECPFDDYHSNPGDPDDRACLVVNAGDGLADVFVIKCQHDSCQQWTSLDMLGRLIADEALPNDVLTDASYNPVADDEPNSSTSGLTSEFPVPPRDFGKFHYAQFGGRPWLHKVGADGEGDERLHTPCVIEAGVIFADQGNKRGLRVKLQDENGQTQTIDLAAGSSMRSYGTELKVTLREQGLLMDDKGESHLVRMFKQNQPPNPITVYNSPGWHEVAFITPFGTVLGTNQQMELSAENQPSGAEYAGSLTDWTAATAAAFHSEVLHFQVGILAGFVSPLLQLCGYPSVWIAYTGSTSKGKSTAQKLQAACWGEPTPKRGLFGNFNGTAAASEALFARASGAGFAMDEAHTIDGKELTKMIFKGSGDGGADRLTRTAELRRARSWSLLTSISNETSIDQKIRAAGGTVPTGLGARVLDINVEDAPSLDASSMRAIEAAFENHGHAGAAFVRAVMSEGHARETSGLRAIIEAKSDLLAGARAQPAVRRAARIAGLVWEAGMIAQRAQLIPADTDVDAIVKRLWERAMEAETAPAHPRQLQFAVCSKPCSPGVASMSWTQ
jgi:hypothetical protein